MGFDLHIFNDCAEGGLEANYIEWLVDERWIGVQTHFTKLWEYYTNPIYEVSGISGVNRKVNESGRCYVPFSVLITQKLTEKLELVRFLVICQRIY